VAFLKAEHGAEAENQGFLDLLHLANWFKTATLCTMNVSATAPTASSSTVR